MLACWRVSASSGSLPEKIFPLPTCIVGFFCLMFKRRGLRLFFFARRSGEIRGMSGCEMKETCVVMLLCRFVGEGHFLTYCDRTCVFLIS